MSTYQIQAPTRVCAATGAALKPNEKFVSALFEDQGKLVRRDYSLQAWANVSASLQPIAFWISRIPEEGKKAKLVVNEEVLVDCLEHLSNNPDPSKTNFRYIVALLLMRKKRLRFEDLLKRDGQEILVLRDYKTKKIYEIPDPRLDEDQIDKAQDEVFAVLGWS